MLLAQRPPAFHCRSLRESGGEEAGGTKGQAGGAEGRPGASDDGERADAEDRKWTDGG